MRLNKSKINKFITYSIFMAAFFMQAYVDGKYVAYGVEPMALKIIKYLLVTVGIIWGICQLQSRKGFIFLKEFCNVTITLTTFLIVSLVLILFRGGDLSHSLELIMRYFMSIIYAFVLLNVLEFEDIYNFMVYYLIVSLLGWFIQIGDRFFDISAYAMISFMDSYSPFESHYFSPSAIICCAFFLYYRRNKWTQIASFMFALMTFKRVQIVFAIAFLILALFFDPNKRIQKKTYILFCVGIILLTVGYYYTLQPKYEWIIEGITGQDASKFTSGRSNLLRSLLYSGYKMAGLGTSEVILGRTIEMELISIMLEMSFPVLALFVFCYSSVAGKKIYAMLVMLYLMVLLMTGSTLYNVFMWTASFLFFGSVNYLRTETFHPKRRTKTIVEYFK